MRDIEIHTDPKSKAPYGLLLDPSPTNHQPRTAEEVFERCKRSVLSKWRSDIFVSEGKEEIPRPSRQRTKQILDQQTGQLDFGAVVDALGVDSTSSDQALIGRNRTLIPNEEEDDAGHGGAFDSSALHGQIVPVSISHDGEYVVATALCSYEIIAREQIAAKRESETIGEEGKSTEGVEETGRGQTKRPARRRVGSTRAGAA